MHTYLLILIKLSFLLVFLNLSYSSSLIKAYFLDVGQAEASFIITPSSTTLLIDAADTSPANFKYVYDFIKQKGFSKIKYLIISHPHEDHIGGVKYLLENLEVEKIYDPNIPTNSKTYNEMIKIIKEKNINYNLAREGVNIKLEEDIILNVLYPPANLLSRSINNNSLVARINYKKFSILYTGDIEKKAEIFIVEKYKYNSKVIGSTVLKVPHHGSSSSSTDKFIKLVYPEIAIISCGVNNKFGHPHIETLEQYNKYNIKIFRTDIDGTIEIISDGNTYRIKKIK
ncbi:MAG: MBL fold metallo-hydrolase [Endomicrobia bacterium]|nr:MBL fold metallo-hydrolase [Endomicrobiia bacterium]